jgi:putative acetyltransferase
METIVRVMRADEFEAMRELSAHAFGDNPQIRELLDLLRASWTWDDELSFVAERDGELVGQVLFTHAFLDTPKEVLDVLLLSPIGVRPDVQGEGIGGQLIRTALAALSQRSEPLVFLEGHPGYYPRFGFRKAGELGFVAPSTRIPAAAFMVYVLPAHRPGVSGQLVYPDAFWRAGAVGP